MDKAVKPVSDPAVSHNDNADTAHTGTALIRRLEIYRRKIFHPKPFTLFYIRNISVYVSGLMAVTVCKSRIQIFKTLRFSF